MHARSSETTSRVVIFIMVNVTDDVAEQFASYWNLLRDDDALPADFWPCCRILEDDGLVIAPEERLAAISVGPFKIAVQRPDNPVRDFIEILFPSVVASIPAGETVTGAVSGALSAACTCFVKLLQHGVVFGRSEPDQLRWNVLLFIRRMNAIGIWPTRDDVASAFSSGTASIAFKPTEPDVRWAIAWLTLDSMESPKAVSSVALVSLRPDGGLECLI